MVDREHSIQVVHFVLNEFGEGIAGSQFPPPAHTVLVPQPHFPVALQADHQVRKREAIVEQLKPFFASKSVFRVDQFVIDPLKTKKDNADRPSDLDGADAAAESMCALELVERVGEILDDAAGIRGVDRPGNLSQQRVAKLQDPANRHTPMVTALTGAVS